MDQKDPQSTPSGDFTVAGWLVQAAGNRLSNGTDVVKLEPRTMGVLVCLANHSGDVVTRQQLEADVWRGAVVGNDALSHSIAKLRKAFGDDRGDPHVIETIPKVGYRLIAPVENVLVEDGSKSLERKLAAVLYADVAEYSRLTEVDEETTHRALNAHLDALSNAIAHHNGRVVHYAGDAVLAEFGTVVEALSSAVAVQREFAAKNKDVPADQVVQFRIGINLGDVIVDRDDLYGDGVNVAARLESLADPGGICISESVHSAAGNKLGLTYEPLGEQHVKNIARPIRAYRVLLDGEVTECRTAVTASPNQRSNHWWLVGGVIALIIAVGGTLLWIEPSALKQETAPTAKQLSMTDKPSIAVLPFANMSNDPEQEFFADGITEDLITDLSKVSGLFVIARNSVFTYKDKPVKAALVAEELNVRYVLEGSVRRAGNQVRINAQLIDATTGGHLWAERYDGKLEDIFGLQDRVTQKIVDELAVTLTLSETDTLAAHGTSSVEAYDAFLHGLRYLNVRDETDTEAYYDARERFEEALRLDPNYGDAMAALSVTYWHSAAFKDFQGPYKSMAIDLAKQSLSLAANALAHRTLARTYLHLDGSLLTQVLDVQVSAMNMDLAVAEIRKAIALEPNNADSLADLAYYLAYAGEAEESIALIKRARRLNPNFPAWYHRPPGIAHLIKRDYGSAIEELIAWHRSEKLPMSSALLLTSAYALAGDAAKANETLLNLRKSLPSTKHYTVQSFSRRFPFKHEDDRLLIEDGLRKAGVADRPE
jgi:TolB-like protein/class 3 adenylate cyclase/tetratricopeptide (TPR) repeat protein